MLVCFKVDGGLSEWGPWGECSKSCGGGDHSRKRTCTNPPRQHGGKDCSGLGDKVEKDSCNTQGCPGNHCWINADAEHVIAPPHPSSSVGQTWNDPTPAKVDQHWFGKRGNLANGTLFAEFMKNMPKFCTYLFYFVSFQSEDGGYTEWSKWSECSATCGKNNIRTRSRTCTNPPPAHGGKDCSDLGEDSEKKKCKKKSCAGAGNLRFPVNTRL